MDQNATSGVAFEKIIPSQAVQPATERELVERALFFATALGMECTHLVRAYIAYCEDNSGPDAQQPEISKDGFSEAVKESLCLCIWLTLYEHAETEDSPEWFKTFLAEALTLCDRLYPTPTAKELMGKYKLSDGVELACQLASMNVCHRLQLGSTAPDASIHLASMLLASENRRAELLKLSLTLSVPQLDQMIQEGI